VKVRNAELFTSCAHPSHFPETDLPEVAFLGRSNVGKSSLLNALVQRKQLARTSGTPGKTRMIHFFQVEIDGVALMLVDLPGYGFARVSKSERASWQSLIESYLENRPALRAAILLQDIRREVSEDETLLLEWLAEREVPSLVALTKVDKLKSMRRKQRVGVMKKSLAGHCEQVVATSSTARQGVFDLWRAIRERL
jgi:GTP-binding protein